MTQMYQKEGCNGREGRERGRKGLWCVPTLTGIVGEELSIDVCLLIGPGDLLADTSPVNDEAKMSFLCPFGNECFQISCFMVILDLGNPLFIPASWQGEQ